MMGPCEPETAVLFGDAAAAAVLTASGPGESSAVEGAAFATFSSGAELTEFPGGGSLHHPNDPDTTPEQNQFHMHGLAVLKHALRVMGPFLDSFFDRLGWDRSTFDRVVPHQASRLGVAQCTARWGFRPEQLVLNLPRAATASPPRFHSPWPRPSTPATCGAAARVAGRHRSGVEPGGGRDVLSRAS